MGNVVHIEGLTKTFGKGKSATHALAGVDFDVNSGEVMGFLGPNGAGKSTTIRIILGMLSKTDGNITLFGEDPFVKVTHLHKKLVYVPGEVNLWPSLTGGETIDFLAKLHGLDTGSNEYRSKREELVKIFDLDVTKKTKQYSKGNKQKVALISAFVVAHTADIELVIFDEPTSGLDPLMEEKFVEQVKSLKTSGKAILLSSHILSEVEKLCDRVSIIKSGKIIKSGTIDEIKASHGEGETLESAFLESYE